MGGGAFLLTLSVVLGVLLITWPAPTENIDRTAHGATAVTYETIELTDDNAANLAKINAHPWGDTGNYRYVMTADWAPTVPLTFYGNAVIFDLQGYTYSPRVGGGTAGKFSVYCTTFELTDSSPAGNGTITTNPEGNADGHPTVILSTLNEAEPEKHNQTLVLSGGNWINGVMHCYASQVIFRGGNFAAKINDKQHGLVSFLSLPAGMTPGTYTVADYLEALIDADTGLLQAVRPRAVDGLVHQTIILGADDTANLALINAHGSGDNGNYRYVLTADWGETLTRTVAFYGNSVIFDLQGYTYYSRIYRSTTTASDTAGKLMVYSTFFELTDSSPAGTGKIVNDSDNGLFLQTSDTADTTKKLIISGGTCLNGSAYSRSGEIIIRAGNYTRGPKATQNVFYTQSATVTVAPYLVSTYNGQGAWTAVKPWAGYLLSVSASVSGVYNYEFGFDEISDARVMANYTAPAGKTYYLWARNADGAYQYLNIVFRDGQWVAA